MQAASNSDVRNQCGEPLHPFRLQNLHPYGGNLCPDEHLEHLCIHLDANKKQVMRGLQYNS
jgi:hypothetical protein